MKSYALQKNEKNKSDLSSKSEACTNWYLYTYNFYDDGSYDYTVEYLFTTCGGDECQSTKVINDHNYKIVCGGGGGVDDVQYIDEEIKAASEEPSITRDGENINLNTGLITQNAVWEWKCGTGSIIMMSNFYNWYYKSYETGTLEKANRNDPWQFQSLSHSSIQTIGQTPPSHEYTIQLGAAISNIATDKLTARMNLYYVVYERIAGTTQTKSWQINTQTICIAN